jgi:hypothetical protein
MQIRFSYDTKYGRFSDALNLPDDHTYTENDIELMKEARRDAWISYIDSTQVESTPVTEETPLENTTEP